MTLTELLTRTLRYDPAQHLADARIVMPPHAAASVDAKLAEIEAAAEAMKKARDALAALSNRHGTCALGIAQADEYWQEAVDELRRTVQRAAAEEYIP